MRNTLFFLPCMILTLPAYAAGEVSAGYEYTDYSSQYGKRNVAFIEAVNRLENNGAVALNVAHGKREYNGGVSFEGTRGRGTLWYNWTPAISTRSGLSVADNSPVFAQREVFGDINVKVLKPVVLTLGGKHSEYYGNTEVNSWSVGGSVYTRSLITSYRYSHYYTVGSGDSDSHLLSLKIKDFTGKGSTQLWISTGTGAYVYDWMPGVQRGKLHSISLKRNQPLTNDLALGVLLGKQWYETPLYSYSGLSGHVSLNIRW